MSKEIDKQSLAINIKQAEADLAKLKDNMQRINKVTEEDRLSAVVGRCFASTKASLGYEARYHRFLEIVHIKKFHVSLSSYKYVTTDVGRWTLTNKDGNTTLSVNSNYKTDVNDIKHIYTFVESGDQPRDRLVKEICKDTFKKMFRRLNLQNNESFSDFAATCGLRDISKDNKTAQYLAWSPPLADMSRFDLPHITLTEEEVLFLDSSPYLLGNRLILSRESLTHALASMTSLEQAIVNVESGRSFDFVKIVTEDCVRANALKNRILDLLKSYTPRDEVYIEDSSLMA